MTTAPTIIGIDLGKNWFHISKRGNTYLRQLFIQGAQSSFLYLKRDRGRR